MCLSFDTAPFLLIIKTNRSYKTLILKETIVKL